MNRLGFLKNRIFQSAQKTGQFTAKYAKKNCRKKSQAINYFKKQQPKNQDVKDEPQGGQKVEAVQPKLISMETFIETTKGALIGTVTTLTVNYTPLVVIKTLGWTAVGVKASSIAAAIHSSIGIVKTGSYFSYLQSIGASGQGIIRISALPYVVVVGAAVGGGYYVYKYYINPKL